MAEEADTGRCAEKAAGMQVTGRETVAARGTTEGSGSARLACGVLACSCAGSPAVGLLKGTLSQRLARGSFSAEMMMSWLTKNAAVAQTVQVVGAAIGGAVVGLVA